MMDKPSKMLPAKGLIKGGVKYVSVPGDISQFGRCELLSRCNNQNQEFHVFGYCLVRFIGTESLLAQEVIMNWIEAGAIGLQ